MTRRGLCLENCDIAPEHRKEVAALLGTADPDEAFSCVDDFEADGATEAKGEAKTDNTDQTKLYPFKFI